MRRQDILVVVLYGEAEVNIDNNKLNNMNWKYVKPTSLDKIQAVEKEYGINLPEDLIK